MTINFYSIKFQFSKIQFHIIKVQFNIIIEIKRTEMNWYFKKSINQLNAINISVFVKTYITKT